MEESERKAFYEWRAQSYADFDKEAHMRYKKAVHLIGPQNMMGANVLDIGCKNAQLKNFLLSFDLTFNYYGLDISLRALKSIKGQKNKHIMVNDVMDGIPLKDRSIDFVFCLEIIEHVENPSLVLSELKRILKDEGIIIVSVPNPYYWSEIRDNFLRKKDTEGHLVSFTYQNMYRMANFLGLKIAGICGTFFRIPYINKLLGGRYLRIPTNSFLTRSYLFKIVKDIDWSGSSN